MVRILLILPKKSVVICFSWPGMSKNAIYISTFLSEKTAEHRFLQECDQNSAHIIKRFGFFLTRKVKKKPSWTPNFFKNVIRILNRKTAKVYKNSITYMVHNVWSHKFFITFNERTIERSKRTIIFMCFFFTVKKKGKKMLILDI